MVISRRGRAVGTVMAGPACWCRRRNAVLRQALLQYVCRPVGVNRAWQTGQVIVQFTNYPPAIYSRARNVLEAAEAK